MVRSEGRHGARGSALAGSVLVLFSACAGQTPPAGSPGTPAPSTGANACSIVPPQHANEESYRKLGADLQAKFLVNVGVGGQITSEQRDTAETSFQRVPDQHVACAMLNATYACLAMAGKETLALALCQTIAATCSPGVSADKACTVSINTTTITGSGNTFVSGHDNNISASTRGAQ
ncbi:MAG TPA: hypothetical protein VK841_07220 [Polyangiaceae bacterium]|nr:hypothetical protein [Polyangiaceae bacterium]